VLKDKRTYNALWICGIRVKSIAVRKTIKVDKTVEEMSGYWYRREDTR
jgi:hypothetical protein